MGGPNLLSEPLLVVLYKWDVFEAWGPAAQSTVEPFAQVAPNAVNYSACE
jgi:hypothetical protein